MRLPSVRWDASFARNLAPDYCRFNAVHMHIKTTMKKKKQKGHSNDLRTTILRLEEPRHPPHIPSFYSRFSLQPPFIEVLSGLLRAAYWPLVFAFSSFSGLFWPGPFFPIFRQWIPKRCKGGDYTVAGRGSAAARHGIVASGARCFACARCGPRRYPVPRLGPLVLPARARRSFAFRWAGVCRMYQACAFLRNSRHGCRFLLYWPCLVSLSTW